MAGPPPRRLQLLRPELAELLRRVRDPPRRARGDRGARTSRAGARLPAGGARAHRRGDRRDGRRRRDRVRDGPAPRAAARETMRQTMAIAGLLPPGEPAKIAPSRSTRLQGARRSGSRSPPGRSRWAPARRGSPTTTSAPATRVETPAFRIARRPVSNASWMRFSEGGGYERREWWSHEGWAWKEEHDITHHPAVAAGHPDAPACHVCWFEADAFARAHGARLPTEAEWERAATWSERTPSRTAPQPATPARSPRGQVWEWTQTRLPRLPRVRRVPLPRVLGGLLRRGLPRAARRLVGHEPPRRAARRFRNWDLPQRRQIFAGVRLARDVR